MAAVKSRDIIVAGVVLSLAYAVIQGANNLLNKIGWNFRGIDIDGIGLTNGVSINIGVKLEVDNKTNFSIPIEKFEGAVFYKGQELTPVRSAAYTEVKANKKTVLRYIVPISKDTIIRIWGKTWTEAFKNFKDSIKPSNYVLTGEVNFRLGNVLHIYDLNEPFVISGTKQKPRLSQK